MKGRIFDIEEFAVFDGPGIRTVVFFKGCPLRCQWCHNPEGLDFGPTRVTQTALCAHCGACDAVCPSRDACTGCGACERACPKACIRIAGREVDSAAVSERVLKNARLLQMNEGGVTFSGGEPLLQPDFLLALRSEMSSLHACVETSGCAPADVFARAVRAMDLVIIDIKLVDPVLHRRYTGADNAQILENLMWLKAEKKPFRVRVPLIPGVNDTDENLNATASLLAGAPALTCVELLPYHAFAGAKYASVRKTYAPGFQTDVQPRANLLPFTKRGLEVHVL